MAKRNQKRRYGCLPLLLILIAGAITLWRVWDENKLSQFPSLPTDASPSYTTSVEAELLTPEPTDYTPLRHYRSTLSPTEQEVYDTIAAAIGGFAPSVDGFRDISPQKLFEITGFVSYDYPEYFWFDGETHAQTTTIGSVTLADLDFTYTMTPGEAVESQAAIRRVTDDYLQSMAGLSDREKVEYVYHRLGAETLYDLGHNDQSCCTVLLDHVGLCAGYARSMQYILSRAGLDILYLSGSSLDGEAHSWNVVKVDDSWYHTDATWGDPLVDGIDPGDSSNQTFAYLFLTTDEILQTRTMDAPDRIPVCTDRSLGYYRRLGLVFDTVTEDLRAALAEAAETDQPLTFQATNAASFADLADAVEAEKGFLTEIGQQVGLSRNMTRYSYAYRLDEATLCIRVEFFFTP